MTQKKNVNKIVYMPEIPEKEKRFNEEKPRVDGKDIRNNSITINELEETVGTYIFIIKCIADGTALTTGDGKGTFVIPAEINNFHLTKCYAHVFTASTSGTVTINIHKGTSTEMLSTAITIDQDETDSSTAATAAVVNAANAKVATANVISVDVDGAGTSTAGLEVRFSFRLT